jgi:hypothetical protein
MAASKLTLDAAVQFKLGRRATKLINNRFKLSGQGILPPSLNWFSIELVAQRPSLNWMAVSAVDWMQESNPALLEVISKRTLCFFPFHY